MDSKKVGISNHPVSADENKPVDISALICNLDLCTAKMSSKTSDEFISILTYLMRSEGVLKVYLFGSYAYGTPNEYSDIDLAVVIKDGMDTLKFMQRVSLDLCDVPVEFDVVADTSSDFIRLSAPDRVTLQREIREKGVVVYGETR